MAEQIKLLELCTSPNKGGLELYYTGLCNALKSRFKITVILAKNNSIEERFLPNTHIIRLGKRLYYIPILTALKLAKIIDRENIQVIHLHWNKDLTLAVIAKLFSKARPKIILMRHMQFPSRKDGFLHRFLYRNIDHIVAITHTMANDIKRFIPEEIAPPISVNYLGVDKFKKVSEETIQQCRALYDPNNIQFLIGSIGRIDPQKGQKLLLKSMLVAKQKRLPFKLLIVGEAKKEIYMQELKQFIREHQLEEYVIFTGFVTNPKILMQVCDTIVLTTSEETFGLVLIEAMSVGTPVIGSNRGGVLEIIDHQENGLLFESENSESLFKALFQIYKNKATSQIYAKKALVKVNDKFSAKKHIERMSKCIESVAYHQQLSE